MIDYADVPPFPRFGVGGLSCSCSSFLASTVRMEHHTASLQIVIEQISLNTLLSYSPSSQVMRPFGPSKLCNKHPNQNTYQTPKGTTLGGPGIRQSSTPQGAPKIDDQGLPRNAITERHSRALPTKPKPFFVGSDHETTQLESFKEPSKQGVLSGLTRFEWLGFALWALVDIPLIIGTNAAIACATAMLYSLESKV